MIYYDYRSLPFKVRWYWFTNPFECPNTDEVIFFSYEDTVAGGFKKRNGLTTVIDLTKDTDELWNNLREKYMRKQIEKGTKNGIEVRHDNDYKSFYSIYKLFRKSSKLPIENTAALRPFATIVNAYRSNVILSTGLFLGDGEIMRAWALASIRHGLDGKNREIVGQANRMIIWETIVKAKSDGYKLFDLGGIDPASDKQGDRQLLEFKEAYGGARRNVYYYSKTYSSILKFLKKHKLV